MISIIVPIYKAEKFLKMCIESVLAQTYQDWELLLIDDGSPDSCPTMCDDYARRDARIHAMHKENGGVSSARNVGLDVAKGEYIMFLDSDDTLEKEALGTCIRKAEESGADVVQFQAMEIDEEGKRTGVLSDITEDVIISDKEYSRLVMAPSVPLVIWDKLYKRSVIGDKRFIEGIKIGEDFLFLLKTFCDSSSKIARIKEYLYNYRIVSTSATRTIGDSYNAAYDTLLEGVIKIFEEQKCRECCVDENVFKEKIAKMLLKSISNQGFFKKVKDSQINILDKYCSQDSIQDEMTSQIVGVLKRCKSKRRMNYLLTRYYLRNSIKKIARQLLSVCR